jgi:hypothetical protein
MAELTNGASLSMKVCGPMMLPTQSLQQHQLSLERHKTWKYLHPTNSAAPVTYTNIVSMGTFKSDFSISPAFWYSQQHYLRP